MKLKFMIVALAVLGLSPALYGQNFPTKPIELVVSSSPGGGIDLIFRLLAEELAKTLKVQVGHLRRQRGGCEWHHRRARSGRSERQRVVVDCHGECRRKGRRLAQGRLHAVRLIARPSGDDERGQSEGPGEFGP